MPTRRSFLGYTALGLGALSAGPSAIAFAAPGGRLIDAVAAACRRLAPQGWRQMLHDATGGELDLGARDLGHELAKKLTRINRAMPGFGDFAQAGTRAIEPGQPDLSLLYHAFASPAVVADGAGRPLKAFPTPAEIDALENYIYGVQAPSLADLRGIAAGRKLAIAVYALQYRNVAMSVHGRHAELCLARTGISRLGNLEPHYDARARNFVGVDEARPFDFRVTPRRFAAFLAVQMPGAAPSFGPQDALASDHDRPFWVPIHKLFSGRECIRGLDLRVSLSCGLRNDEIAQFRHFLDQEGLKNNWTGETLEKYPFVIKDRQIGALSTLPEYGTGMLVPKPNPLTQPAKYQGHLLTVPVDGAYTSGQTNLQLSSLQVLPPTEVGPPAYMDDAGQLLQRPGPEYVNIRHRVLADGKIEDLNPRPDLQQVLRHGGYDTLQYIDGAGDGWVEAHCPELEPHVDGRLAAYCMVGLPDFFPKVTQRDLMQWWRTEVPALVRAALWVIQPLALSQTRIAGNITLPVPFALDDTTITAIVTQPATHAGPVQQANGPWTIEKAGLPDGSPGLFDPGWDTSQGIYYEDDRDPTKTYKDDNRPIKKFLAGYGLGSPFIEDAKLCASLGAYWPGVAPDATREFQPDKRLNSIEYPYPSVIPLTDEEIGSAPLPNGKFMPWDGVRGPRAAMFQGKKVVAYTDARHVDYIDLPGTMTAALTARIDSPEYKARILAMEAVYWALGIHDPDFAKQGDAHEAVNKVIRAKAAWAVLSFRTIAADDKGMADAAEQAKAGGLPAGRRYAFEVFRWGKQTTDPADLRTVFVENLEQVSAYVAATTVLIRHGDGPWRVDTSMPT